MYTVCTPGIYAGMHPNISVKWYDPTRSGGGCWAVMLQEYKFKKKFGIDTQIISNI